MMKNRKSPIILTTLVCLLPVAVGLILWTQLPDQIVSRFTADGTVNGLASKSFMVFGMPVFFAIVHLICLLFVEADPRRTGVSSRLRGIIYWICPSVSLLVCLSCYAVSLGADLNIGALAYGFVGILFIIIGNYLSKCRRNYTVGIKLPWTLDNDENWDQTHRIGARCFILGGIFFLCNMIIRKVWIIWLAFFIAAVIPIACSYVMYRSEEQDK